MQMPKVAMCRHTGCPSEQTSQRGRQEGWVNGGNVWAQWAVVNLDQKVRNGRSLLEGVDLAAMAHTTDPFLSCSLPDPFLSRFAPTKLLARSEETHYVAGGFRL